MNPAVAPRSPRYASKPRRLVAPPIAFHAFIAYADIPAAGRAMDAINDIFRATPRGHVLKPMLWRFDQLTAPKWHERALVDACAAAIVIFTSTPAAPFSAKLEGWVSELLARKRGRSTTLVALLGPEEAWTVTIEQPAAVASPHPAVVEEQRLVA